MNIHIEVKNPQHVSKGVEYIEVDGKRLDSCYLPIEQIKDGTKIVVYMGKDAKTYQAERV